MLLGISIWMLSLSSGDSFTDIGDYLVDGAVEK
jgi:hypothetical protein